MTTKRRKRLCPVCGERITVDGRTTDGRLIGSCGDAFARRTSMLVPERGLKNTRRNRRWLALVRMFSHQVPGGAQELCETLAWAAINTWETTP